MIKLALTVLLIAVAVFVALLALAWWGQERIVFQPPRDVPVPDLRATRLEFPSDDGTPLFAYLVHEGDSTRREADGATPGRPRRRPGSPA